MKNEITSRMSSTPVACIEVDGVQHNQAKSIAETLNNHFCSIGSKLVAKLKPGVAQNNQPNQVSTKQDLLTNCLSVINSVNLKPTRLQDLIELYCSFIETDAAIQITPVLNKAVGR